MPTIYSATDNSPIATEDLTGLTVIVTVPAAFSGTCTEECVPGVLQHKQALLDAGAERIIVVTSDQPFAINAWVEAEDWQDSGLEFASDFNTFEMRSVVGKLSDEDGKADVPGHLAGLLRRSYSVLKDGKVIWQYTEPDTGSYTLDANEMLEALRDA